MIDLFAMASAGNDAVHGGRNGAHVRALKLKGSSANESFDTGGNMRRPVQDISSAFGRPTCSDDRDVRRQAQQYEHAVSNTSTAIGERDGGRRDQISRQDKKLPQRDIACTHDTRDPAQSNSVAGECGANTSAASQLRARLRGQLVPAVPDLTVRPTCPL